MYKQLLPPPYSRSFPSGLSTAITRSDIELQWLRVQLRQVEERVREEQANRPGEEERARNEQTNRLRAE